MFNTPGKKVKPIKLKKNKSSLDCYECNNNFGNYNLGSNKNSRNKREFISSRGEEKWDYREEFPALFGYFNSNNKNKTNDFFMNNADYNYY